MKGRSLTASGIAAIACQPRTSALPCDAIARFSDAFFRFSAGNRGNLCAFERPCGGICEQAFHSMKVFDLASAHCWPDRIGYTESTGHPAIRRNTQAAVRSKPLDRFLQISHGPDRTRGWKTLTRFGTATGGRSPFLCGQFISMCKEISENWKIN